MSPTAQFESSGLQNKASRSRKPAKPIPDYITDFGPDEDLDELLEGEIDTEQNTAHSAPAEKPQRAKPKPGSAKTTTTQKSQSSAMKQTTKTPKKKPQRPSTRQTASRSRSKLPQRKSSTHDLKATAAPLLGTVGILLLIPALWSVLLLVGVGVPGSAREDSRPMAAIMLACWPIAICLIITAAIFFKQTIRAKKEMKQAKVPVINSSSRKKRRR